MAFLSEAEIELALLEQLQSLGYGIEYEEDIGPDGKRPKRESHAEVLQGLIALAKDIRADHGRRQAQGHCP